MLKFFHYARSSGEGYNPPVFWAMIGIPRKTIFSTIKTFVGTEGLGACFMLN